MNARELLYKRVYEILKNEIEIGVFQPGDRIPTEHELMKRFEVSRVTANRAVKMLTDEGIVLRRAGMGTFVTGNDSIGKRLSFPKPQIRASTKGLIGFVIPNIGYGYGVQLVVTTQRILQQKGLTLTLACSHGQQSIEQDAIAQLVNYGVEGLLIFPSDGEYYNDTILQLYVERFPMVIIDKRMPGMPVPYVMSDNVAGAEYLTNHLLELGHTNIAFISTPINGTTSLQKRFDGYNQSLRKAGLTPNPAHHFDSIQFSNVDEEYDELQVRRIEDFLRHHPEVTAVFAARYKIAEHVYMVAKRMRKQVPDDLSITCFDSPPLNSNHWQFTHISQNEQSVATEAVRLLTSLLSGNPDQPMKNTGVLIKPKLVIGNTTKVVRGGG